MGEGTYYGRVLKENAKFDPAATAHSQTQDVTLYLPEAIRSPVGQLLVHPSAGETKAQNIQGAVTVEAPNVRHSSTELVRRLPLVEAAAAQSSEGSAHSSIPFEAMKQMLPSVTCKLPVSLCNSASVPLTPVPTICRFTPLPFTTRPMRSPSSADARHCVPVNSSRDVTAL